MDKLLHPAYAKCFRTDYETSPFTSTVVATINLPASKWTSWKIDDQLFIKDIEARLKANQHEMAEQGSSVVRLDDSSFEADIYARVECLFGSVQEGQNFHFLTTAHNYTVRPLLSLGTLFLLSWFAPVILMIFMLLQNGSRGRDGG
jgi:hypothetical protein